MDRAAFFGNRAGDAGLAIQSVGAVENMINTTFESNTYYCPSGQFGYDVGASEDEVMALYCEDHLANRESNIVR